MKGKETLLSYIFQGGTLPPLTFLKSYVLVLMTVPLCLKQVKYYKQYLFQRI